MANIKVAVRARPLLSRELESQSPVVLDMRGQSTILFKSEAAVAVGEMRDASKEFIYDHSYWSVSSEDSHFASQEQIFSDLGHHILDSAFEGYNGCIFAYGQTGSGKTYTMMGNEQSPGLIPRICDGLFKGMKKSPNQVSYKVEVSYMEIYNEKVRDLLKMSVPNSNSPQHNLKVREHPKEGPYVENLSRHQVSDYQAIEEIISLGNSFRVTAATKMNDVSSRSHAIFTITFMQAKYSHDIPSETVSKIHLVDLAGSERASQTGAEGQRLKEGGNINKSLVCLGNVIQALAEASSSSRKKNRFIPYRDSVLTWLLKDSLGGNSKTIMIATVSPCQYSYAETLSTLRYASRAKNIINKPKINEDENVKLIRELREEIKRLMGIISNTDVESTLHIAADLHHKEEKIQSLTRSWAGKWGDIQKIIEERDLALRSEGVKMTVASEQPHLLGVDEDRFGAGVVLYYLKSGDTTIGHVDAPIENDISFKSESIANFHCKITLLDNGESVYLQKLDGVSFVNQIPVKQDEPVKLSHSDTLKLGSNTYLRFNNPQEAMKLKEASPMGPNNTSHDSFASAVWSPLMDTSSSSLIQTLEQERDALRKRQDDIEHEYEDKIREVQDQLKREEEDKAELLRELDRLKKEKLTASLNFSSSLVRTNTYSPGVHRIPLNFTQTPSESDTSLSLDQREVTGGEDSDCLSLRTSSPSLIEKEEEEEHSHHRMRCYSKDETMTKALFRTPVTGGNDKNSESDNSSDDHRGVEDTDYCLLDEPNCLSPTGRSSDSGDSQSHEAEMLKRIAEQEKQELKEDYESRLQRELSENKKMRNEILDLELRLQTEALQRLEATSTRKRSNAVVGSETDFDRSLPQYHSHRASRIKIEVPSYHLRGTGWTAYHVYAVQISVHRDQWTVHRRYEQFREFHSDMCLQHPEVSSLNLPPSKWIGVRKEPFVSERRKHLEIYIKAFLAIITTVSSCELSEVKGRKVSMETLQNFHKFFRPGSLEASFTFRDVNKSLNLN